MAKLTLQITGNVDDVKRKIQIVRDELSSIEKHPIKIGVQASGLDAIAARLKEISDTEIKAAEAAAKLANAEASKMRAQVKAAQAGVAVANAEKQVAQATEQTAKSADHLAISGKQLVQMFLDSAKQTDYAKSKGNELFAAYQKLQIVSQSVASAQTQIGSSMALVIRNAGTLQAQIRSLANVYNQLATAQGGGGGGLTTGGATGGGLTAQNNALVTTPGREIVWSRYGDWRDSVIEGQWRPMTEGAGEAADAVNTAAAAAGNANTAFNTMRAGMQAAWNTMNEGTPIADALGDSIGNIIVKITTWQVVNGIVASIKRAFKDALDTMREVDQQLTNIQKVSDLTAADIARIGESAYETASKYGVAADEYLSAVYTFQKAGLGDSAEKMGELAVKTMLVGDTTADVATKFIIASNAAWKYGGSVEELSRLVDEADKLNNTYAVSLSDIAEGLPIVAATAAQAGMTAEQTMAAISTIVASTGQSASKAATALRAIIMNLIGETGELDDGLNVTEETVASLNAVLNQYARSSLEAAEAQGKILDPMEAVAALAKAAEDGFLNEAQLFDVLSGLGGKLRTTQLTALVNAQEMYNSMLDDTADAAGTADREISVMLDSWNSKTQVLTNTFTQFISHLVDSKGIKAGIDTLTNLVKVLDSGAGKFATLTVAVLGAVKAFTMLATTGIGATLVSLASGFITAAEAATVLSTALLSSPLFWAAAIAGVILLIDKLIVTTKEHAENVKKSVEEYEELEKQVDELNGKIDENKRLIEEANEAGRDDSYTKRLENENKQLQIQIDLLELKGRKEKENAHEEAIAGLKSKSYQIGTGRYEDYTVVNGSDVTTSQVEVFKSGTILEYVNYLLKLGRAGEDVSESLSEAYDTLLTFQKGLDTSTEEGKIYSQAIATAIEYIGSFTDSLLRKTQATKEDTQATDDNTGAKQNNTNATNANTAANTTLQKAFEDVDKKGSLTYGTLKELDALYPGLSAKILDANGNLTAEGQAALSTRASLYELISSMITANTTSLNFDAQIAALQQLATEAGVAAGSISAVFAAANMAANGTGDWDEISNMTPDQVARYRASTASNSMLALIRNQIKDQETLKAPGGGGGGSTEDPRLSELKEILAMRKQELSFLEASGASEDEQIAKMKQIQDALHDAAEYLRSIEGESANVVALSTEWWNIQEKITKLEGDKENALKDNVSLLKQQLSFMEASGASEEDRIGKMREIQKALHEQAEYLRSIGADEKDILALSTEWWNVENKILDIQEKIAKQLRDEIAATLESIVGSLEIAAKAMNEPLQEQLDLMEKQREEAEKQREEEEKKAAVTERQIELEKARIALINAQNERTVRQYNAASGQWEWVANAKNVEAAQKNLDTAQKNLIDAQADLAKYYADKQYEAAKENLEKQIKTTENVFDLFRDALKEAAQAIKDGKMSYQEAYKYIKGKMKDIYDEYGIDLTGVLKQSIGELTGIEKSLASLLFSLGDIDGGLETLAEILATVPEQYCEEILQSIAAIFESEDLTKEAKTAIVSDIHAIFSNESLTKEAKSKILQDISALFSDPKLSADSKVAITSAIKALVGNGDDAESAVALFTSTIRNALAGANNPERAINELAEAISNGTLNISSIGDILAALNGEYANISKETADILALTKMQANSIAWHLAAEGSQERLDLEAENQMLGAQLGLEYNSVSGQWMKNGEVAYTLSNVGGNWTSSLNTAILGLIDKINNIEFSGGGSGGGGGGGGGYDNPNPNPGGGAMTIKDYQDMYMKARAAGDTETMEYANRQANIMRGEGDVVTAQDDIAYVRENGGYDYGGILRGLGGIKATTQDEMVLPPHTTRTLLQAERNGSFDALLDHLGIVTAAANGYASFGGAISRSSIGSQHNGDVFYINGELMESVTTGTTIGQLAQMARSLNLKKGS